VTFAVEGRSGSGGEQQGGRRLPDRDFENITRQHDLIVRRQARKDLGEQLAYSPFEQSPHDRVVDVDDVDARGSAFLNVVRRRSAARQGRTGNEGCRDE